MRRPGWAGHHVLRVSQGRSDRHDLKRGDEQGCIRSRWGADECSANLEIKGLFPFSNLIIKLFIILFILLQLNLLDSLSFNMTVWGRG